MHVYLVNNKDVFLFTKESGQADCDEQCLFFSPFQILKERFGMVAPDVQIEDGKGTILISSEEGETEGEPELS